MYCPNCGTEFADGVNFCPKCGTQRPQPKAATENSTEQPIPPSPISDTPIEDTQPADQAADVTSSASKEASPAKKKSKLPLILGIVGVVIVAFIVIAALLGGDDSPEISTVRNGYLGEYTDMTVDEILDGYYSDLLGYEPGTWDSGVTDDGKTIVQVEYTNEELGPITIQFSMLDDSCFKVTAFVDPLEDVEEPSDLLASLNKIYLLAYTSRFPQEEIAEKESELLEKLASVNATSVRYGASKDYTGDRTRLYELFDDTPLEMSVVELLDLYGIMDNSMLSGSDINSTAVFSSGTFATVNDASSVYETGGIIVDLDVTGNQVTYTVTSASATQRIASISGVADQGNTIHASGIDDWGNLVEGDIVAMDDDFISVEFELITANADAMWELDCPYTILTRCVDNSTDENPYTAETFDVTNADLKASDMVVNEEVLSILPKEIDGNFDIYCSGANPESYAGHWWRVNGVFFTDYDGDKTFSSMFGNTYIAENLTDAMLFESYMNNEMAVDLIGWLTYAPSTGYSFVGCSIIGPSTDESSAGIVSQPSDPTGSYGGYTFTSRYTQEDMNSAVNLTDNYIYNEYWNDRGEFVNKYQSSLIYLDTSFPIWMTYTDHINLWVGNDAFYKGLFAECYGSQEDIAHIDESFEYQIYGILEYNDDGDLILRECQFIPL